VDLALRPALPALVLPQLALLAPAPTALAPALRLALLVLVVLVLPQLALLALDLALPALVDRYLSAPSPRMASP
jgi:hypothetical protein